MYAWMIGATCLAVKVNSETVSTDTKGRYSRLVEEHRHGEDDFTHSTSIHVCIRSTYRFPAQRQRPVPCLGFISTKTRWGFHTCGFASRRITCKQPTRCDCCVLPSGVCSVKECTFQDSAGRHSQRAENTLEGGAAKESLVPSLSSSPSITPVQAVVAAGG